MGRVRPPVPRPACGRPTRRSKWARVYRQAQSPPSDGADDRDEPARRRPSSGRLRRRPGRTTDVCGSSGDAERGGDLAVRHQRCPDHQGRRSGAPEHRVESGAAGAAEACRCTIRSDDEEQSTGPPPSSAFSVRIDPRTPHVAISQTDAASSASRRCTPADGSPPRPGRASTGRAPPRTPSATATAVARITERTISRPSCGVASRLVQVSFMRSHAEDLRRACRRPGTSS